MQCRKEQPTTNATRIELDAPAKYFKPKSIPIGASSEPGESAFFSAFVWMPSYEPKEL